MIKRGSFKTAVLSGLIAVVIFLMPANLYASDLSGNNEKILSDVVAISGGERAVYAIKKDGTVWATGSNEDGQLGIGITSNDKVLEPESCIARGRYSVAMG